MESQHGKKYSSVDIFYFDYQPQRIILSDFYQILAEEQFDYRMVATATHKADTPRESLGHILHYRWIVLRGVQAGKLKFETAGLEQYKRAEKVALLSEWERFEQELEKYLRDEQFDEGKAIEVPWGGTMPAISVFYLLRDHDILHIGWNLALQDHLEMERYPSLKEYWGD